MAKAIFYDRKNKREVSSEQLGITRLVQNVAVGDADDDFTPTGRRYRPIINKNWLGEPMTKEQFESYKEKGYLEDSPNLTWEEMEEEKTPIVLYLHETLIADLFYKSDKCPPHINGDLYCNISDLVLLRFE